jgi:hypothetical protein
MEWCPLGKHHVTEKVVSDGIEFAQAGVDHGQLHGNRGTILIVTE